MNSLTFGLPMQTLKTSVPIPMIYLKEILVLRLKHLWTKVFIAISSVFENLKLPKCLSEQEWSKDKEKHA